MFAGCPFCGGDELSFPAGEEVRRTTTEYTIAASSETACFPADSSSVAATCFVIILQANQTRFVVDRVLRIWALPQVIAVLVTEKVAVLLDF